MENAASSQTRGGNLWFSGSWLICYLFATQNGVSGVGKMGFGWAYSLSNWIYYWKMAPWPRLELGTQWLTVICSTNWAIREQIFNRRESYLLMPSRSSCLLVFFNYFQHLSSAMTYLFILLQIDFCRELNFWFNLARPVCNKYIWRKLLWLRSQI